MKKGNIKKNRILLHRFFPYFKKYKSILMLDLFCASLTTACDLTLPLIVRRITNDGFNDLSLLTFKYIFSVTVFYILLRCIDAAANFYMTTGGHLMGTKIETDMRNDLFSHIQELSFSYFDNTKVGQLMSRLTSDLFDITEFAHHFPEEMIITSIKIVVSFAIFASMNIWLAVIIFSVLPLMFIVTKKSRRKMKATFRESRQQVGEINAQTEDSLLGIRIVKSFTNEDIEKEKFDKGAKKYLNIKRNNYFQMGIFHTIVRGFDGAMYILVVATGAVFMKKGLTTVGDFSASLLMVSNLLSSIRRLVEFSEQFNRGITGIERFTQVMDIVSEIKDSENAVEVQNVRGEIEFRDVSFIYPGTEKKVLNNVNIKIKPGENVALAGPSGGGKTTICNLIPRFYDVTGGEILLDGINIKDITLHSLRSNIGVVQQDVYMFSGTVFQNIAYGRPGATRQEVEQAAVLAGAHDFIMMLPEGYDTYCGERGVKLSGGQKQRISIARVFLKNPPILILDEATSALDNESERLVQQSLECLAKGRTTIVIAHRLTTIKNAKEILVLTEDGIAERGSHAELIEKGGIYSGFYSLYGSR